MPINQLPITIYTKYFVGENNEIHKKFQLGCRKEWNAWRA